MRYLPFALLFAIIFASCNKNNALLDEYRLLYIDLENLTTHGYKSYYSPELNRARRIINSDMGTVFYTEIYSDFAIKDEGFFKIKLDNNATGYTRNGNLNINEYGEIVTNDGFSLFEPIILPDSFIPNTLRINAGGSVFVSISNNRELHEQEVGKINIYKVSIELLEYYKNGIYVLKENTDNEIIITGRILHKFLERSNYNLLAVLLRMYYILENLDNKKMVNIEFKKELLKSIMDYIINTGKYSIENFDHGIWLIETSVPFLKYDY